MDNLRQKIKRAKPLAKIRKTQLDQEAAELARIRQEKMACVSRLRAFQHQYMDGVETINKVRQSADHSNLSTLERSVDNAKMRWYQSLKELRNIEGQERAQIAQLMLAERNLKSVEKLENRYIDTLRQKEAHQEQSFQDELSIRKFSQGHS